MNYCRQFTRAHYENFSVASFLIPRSVREHFYPIYAYCRWADDLGDEIGSCSESLQLLDWWETQLNRCYAGRTGESSGSEPIHPVFTALEPTIREFGMPRELFADLLDAFRLDQRKREYQTREELLEYCRLSANPVGRLILYLARTTDETSLTLSDSICSSLQLANHWQDVGRDKRRVEDSGRRCGRRYIPLEDMAAVGYSLDDYEAERCNDAFRQLMFRLTDWAQEGFTQGKALVNRVPKSFQTDIRLFIGGGEAILKAIRRQGGNVWAHRPTVSKAQKIALLIRAILNIQ